MRRIVTSDRHHAGVALDSFRLDVREALETRVARLEGGEQGLLFTHAVELPETEYQEYRQKCESRERHDGMRREYA